MDFEESNELFIGTKVSFVDLKNYPSSQSLPTDSSEFKLCSVFYKSEDIRFVCMLLISNKTIWKKKLNEIDIDKLASKVDMSQKEYYECLSDLLSCWGPKNDSVVFTNGVLEWEKMYDHGFLVPYGVFDFDTLEGSEFIAVMISYFIDQNLSLSDKLDNLSNKVDDLQKGYSELQEHAEALVTEKNNMESTLYSRFLLILNEKKEIISRLSGAED